MPRPGVGNPGNKGGRRKSAYQEHADQAYLMDLWFKKHTKDEITELLSVAGEHSMSDAWLAKGLAGNVDIQRTIFNKLFPDTLNVNMVKPIPIGRQTNAKILKLFSPKKDDNAKNDKGDGVDNDKGNAG